MSSHTTIAHAWAHQSSRNNALRGYAMYYEGPSIYSWGSHFCIARIVDAPDGAPAVLFTTRRYSRRAA